MAGARGENQNNQHNQAWTSQEISMADRRATATNTNRATVLNMMKGKGWSKDNSTQVKGKNKGKTQNKGKNNNKGKNTQASCAPCVNWVAGTCRFRNNCRFSHE